MSMKVMHHRSCATSPNSPSLDNSPTIYSRRGMSAENSVWQEITAKVDVVVVTYGERWAFLSDVLSSIDANPYVGNIFVVDNACSYSVEERVRQQGLNNTRVLRMAHNLGSAGGFSAGVKAAVEGSSNPFLWL